MTKIDIFSGFLGAGKTTLIKKLISESYKGEKIVLIENEFGEIGIDGGFLKDAGIEITEMNSGCICCSLVGDFGEALKKVLTEFKPDRILIEPSGVGKLSDVIRAVEKVVTDDVKISGFTTVADASKCKIYIKNFGEFYNDQIEHASCIVLSRTGDISEEKIKTAVELLRNINKDAVIVTTPWDELSGKQLLDAIEGTSTLDSILDELKEEEDVCPECGHHHDHDHEHNHEHEHEHNHDECGCGHEHHHDHDHDHHHHHADDVFTSWGRETTKKFTKEELESKLEKLSKFEVYGMILRAKGIVEGTDGKWLHFDYVPSEISVRTGSADITGRICVIGSKIDEEEIAELFGVN